MDKVRIGLIGLGAIGIKHANSLIGNKVPGGKLTAVCDSGPNRRQWAKENLGEEIKVFDQVEALLDSGLVDGVLVATPHYTHPELAIQALEKGLHVLIEKPAGVYTKEVLRMNEVAAKNSDLVFGIMYNRRTSPVYRKLRDLVKDGELGAIKRTNWIMTTWYRPQSYYDSGEWRATWAGEGGGVLLNQAPHQLDLWQWICGMPKRVRAFCAFGKYHQIEVEDDVTAYVEYENGATGVFITSTGETPGTDRLEIIGDRGKAVVENGELQFWRLRVSERQFNQEYNGRIGEPECWKCTVPIVGEETAHAGIMSNWVEAILKGTPVVAPGSEGINGLELSNAMYLSTWTDRWVELPIDHDLFYEELQKKIKNSTFKKAGSGE
ncbi:MAG: Gfo/Idh/MocA family oxidoreductase [Firmicutes bacterium]|nr:Gfo/Idh/MocA family oxidoreductase [Bacillota bacterium]